MFRHLVISRLAYPGSKLKTIDYLQRYQGIEISVDTVYRFLDKLTDSLKETIQQISFGHTKKRLDGNISVVFYDMTTLYFESADEDDLRKTGFSKDGKHKHPQIFLGLLVGLGGWPIAYQIYEGNIYEGRTLIPTIKEFESKYRLNKAIIVADSGLLNKKNIEHLEKNAYEYILGARIKSESKDIKNQILSRKLSDGESIEIKKNENQKLIISYSKKRAAKDKHNRQRGLERLEKQIRAGRLTKGNINNRGYNKYLRLEGDISISIDYEKFQADEKWDGLKGYLTNSKLDKDIIIENYKNLWQIEKAFRISKTDLKIRPIFHRLRNRIEAHISISFVAYSVYKELERLLKLEHANISVNRAATLTHTMYEIEVLMPESKKLKNFLLNMDKDQKELIEIIKKYS